MIEPIVIEGFEEATAEVQAAVHVGVVAGLEAVGVYGVERVKAFIQNPFGTVRPAIARGGLYESIFAEVTPAQVLSRLLIAAGAPADTYVDAVEFGTGPHMPPINALLPWVKEQLHVTDENKATKIAWAIAMNMKMHGTQGRHMFRDAEGLINNEAPSIIERQIALSLQRMEAAGGGHAAG